jgi:hypothetical protein
MTTGWICVTFWIASNIALAAWRLYVTRELKVTTETRYELRCIWSAPEQTPRHD